MIIGISGKLGSGKTQVAQIIYENLPTGSSVVVETTFGQHLRQFILACLGLPTHLNSPDFKATLDRGNKDLPLHCIFGSLDLDDHHIMVQTHLLMRNFNVRMCAGLKTKLIQTLRDKTLNLREVMQIVGTDIVRKAYPQAWVKLAEKEILRLKQEYKHILVTDVRFPNEAKLVKDLGGEVIEIIRPNNPHEGGGIQGHSSEQRLPPKLVDIELMNDGDLGDLRLKVVSIMDGLGMIEWW